MRRETATHRSSLSERIGRRQQQLSDLLHQTGDVYAEAHGWTISRTTGLFGFGARRYRDPRFDGAVSSLRGDTEMVSTRADRQAAGGSGA